MQPRPSDRTMSRHKILRGCQDVSEEIECLLVEFR
jgi:hypothetical protein